MNAQQKQPHELHATDKQAARSASTAPATKDQPAQDADQLRENIEHNREQLGDTAQALADKADIRARVTQRVGQHKQQLRDLGQQAQTKLNDQQHVKQLASTVQQRARSNPPMMAGAGLIAVAAVILLRRSRRSR